MFLVGEILETKANERNQGGLRTLVGTGVLDCPVVLLIFSGRRGRRPLRGHGLGEFPSFFRDVMKSLPPRGRGTALAVEGACVTFDLHKFHCNALSLTRQGTPLRYVASFLAKTWSGAPSRREPFSGSVYGGATRSPVRNPSAPLGHLPLHRGGGAKRATNGRPTGTRKFQNFTKREDTILPYRGLENHPCLRPFD